MKSTYSIYEAKAKLSEIIRQVKKRRRITITERGQEVARVIPIESGPSLEQQLEELEAAGIVTATPARIPSCISAVAKKPGALQRFLDSRD